MFSGGIISQNDILQVTQPPAPRTEIEIYMKTLHLNGKTMVSCGFPLRSVDHSAILWRSAGAMAGSADFGYTYQPMPMLVGNGKRGLGDQWWICR